MSEPDKWPVLFDESEQKLQFMKNGPHDVPNTGGGVTIYTGDGSLGGDRTVDLNGHVFHMQQGGTDFITVDPTLDNEATEIISFNPTGLNAANNTVYTTATTANSTMAVSFNAGTQMGSVSLYADEDGSSYTVNASNSTFNGNVLAGNTGALDLVAANGVDASDFFSVGGVPGISGIITIGVNTITVVGGIITAHT